MNMKFIRNRHGDLDGQVTLEYFLLFAAVAVAVIAGLQLFGEQISSALQEFVNAAAKAITN